jgi:hypothetical protein
MAFLLFGPLGVTATAQAASEIVLVTFSDTSPVQYTDPGGNTLGQGVHMGELRCVGEICNQKIEFEPLVPVATTETLVYEYKFKSREAFDPLTETVVVSGEGTISNGGMKTRFAFTGVLHNNGDGTVQVTYVTSALDGSFSFPAVPATFHVMVKNE